MGQAYSYLDESLKKKTTKKSQRQNDPRSERAARAALKALAGCASVVAVQVGPVRVSRQGGDVAYHAASTSRPPKGHRTRLFRVGQMRGSAFWFDSFELYVEETTTGPNDADTVTPSLVAAERAARSLYPRYVKEDGVRVRLFGEVSAKDGRVKRDAVAKTWVVQRGIVSDVHFFYSTRIP